MYYHAGSEIDGCVVWSDATRDEYQAAVDEARELARQHGGRPVVEYWDRRHGERPGDCEAVEAVEFYV